jgi:hypothetical protein
MKSIIATPWSDSSVRDKDHHDNPTLLDLIRVQLYEWPDSLLLTEKEAVRRWVYDPLQDLERRRNRTPFAVAEEQRQRNLIGQAQSSLVCSMQHAVRLYYECGDTRDEQRRWRGCRYGMEGSQYLSGFGAT